MRLTVVRLFTGDDRESHFEDIYYNLEERKPGRWISELLPNTGVEFEETPRGQSLTWHNAPRRQLVVTLSGRLEFESKAGEKRIIEPGDILLAEDLTGGGHRWRLLNDQSWRRVYIHLEDERFRIQKS